MIDKKIMKFKHLTSDKRMEIYQYWIDSGLSYQKIANKFGVSRTTIFSIVKNGYKSNTKAHFNIDFQIRQIVKKLLKDHSVARVAEITEVPYSKIYEIKIGKYDFLVPKNIDEQKDYSERIPSEDSYNFNESKYFYFIPQQYENTRMKEYKEFFKKQKNE